MVGLNVNNRDNTEQQQQQQRSHVVCYKVGMFTLKNQRRFFFIYLVSVDIEEEDAITTTPNASE